MSRRPLSLWTDLYDDTRQSFLRRGGFTGSELLQLIAIAQEARWMTTDTIACTDSESKTASEYDLSKYSLGFILEHRAYFDDLVRLAVFKVFPEEARDFNMPLKHLLWWCHHAPEHVIQKAQAEIARLLWLSIVAEKGTTVLGLAAHSYNNVLKTTTINKALYLLGQDRDRALVKVCAAALDEYAESHSKAH